MDAPRRIEDALAHLTAHPDGFASDRFAEPGSATSMVQRLLALGAERVSLLATGPLPNLMEVALPSDPDARGALFALFAAEWAYYDEDFGADPNGRGEGHEITREEAEAMQYPEAEGEWTEDVGEPLDDGQNVITLWWD